MSEYILQFSLPLREDWIKEEHLSGLGWQFFSSHPRWEEVETKQFRPEIRKKHHQPSSTNIQQGMDHNIHPLVRHRFQPQIPVPWTHQLRDRSAARGIDPQNRGMSQPNSHRSGLLEVGETRGKRSKPKKKTWKLKPKHKLVFKVRLNIILIVSYSDIGVDSQPQETLLKPYEILLFSHPSLSWNELTWREHDAWKRRHVQFGRQPSRAHIDTCHFIADSTLKCTHSSNAIDLWITCAVYPLVN